MVATRHKGHNSRPIYSSSVFVLNRHSDLSLVYIFSFKILPISMKTKESYLAAIYKKKLR